MSVLSTLWVMTYLWFGPLVSAMTLIGGLEMMLAVMRS